MAVKIDNKAYAIPATVEGYGIIYNKAIVKAYREHAEISGSTKTTYTDADGVLQVKNFNELKTVVNIKIPPMTQHQVILPSGMTTWCCAKNVLLEITKL